MNFIKLSGWIAVVTLFFQCSSPNSHEHQGESELEPVSHTVWTDKTELFVEYKPLVVGQESRFAAHVTDMADFKAVTKGTVTVTITANGKTLSNKADSASSPGIFRPKLTPTESGIYKLVFDISTSRFSDRIVIDSIRVYADEATALKNQPAEAGGEDITYLKEQAWKTEFAMQKIKKGEIREIIKTTGQLTSSPSDETVIVANSSGLVSINNPIPIGISIAAGTSLFIIKGKGITENNVDVRYQQAKAEFEKAEKEFQRQTQLRKENINSERDLEQAKLNYDLAKSNFTNIGGNYRSGQNITSPASGFVKSIMVTEGQFVQAGQPLMLLSKNQNIVLKAEVSQKYFSKLPFISSANFKTPYDSSFLDISNFNGRLISVGKNTSANEFYIPVFFQLENRGNIVPGSYADVNLKTTPITNTIVIPFEALQEESDKYYVFIQAEGESFQKRYVTLGVNDGINVQILSGISEGEMLVTKGAYQIKLSSQSSAIPAHGHEH